MTRRQKLLWTSAVVALVFAIASAIAKGGFRRYWRLKKDVRALQARNAKLTHENAQLRGEIHALQNDPQALERAAREELGFIRPGEFVFEISNP